MGKLIGLITAWDAEPFIEPAIKQAIEYCDEVVVSVGLHHNGLARFTDKTMEITEKYKDQITIVEGVNTNNYTQSRSLTLKKMLDVTNNNKAGNWIFILDADEFYFPEDIAKCREIMAEDKYNRIMFPEKTFCVNMQNYANWERDRIKKLTHDNMSFRTNELGYETSVAPYYLETDLGMHHYTFLMDLWFKREFWRIEKGHPNIANQPKKWGWIDNIYMDLDLDNQEAFVNKSKNLWGTPKVMGIFGFKCKEDGTLYKYDGPYPPHIIEAGLHEIEDFRVLYKKQ